MKKFLEKNKTWLIVVLVAVVVIAVSLLRESASKKDDKVSEDLTKWVEAVKGEEKVLTVIALSYCSHCEEYKPVISAIASEYSIPLYWFEIDTMTNADASVLTGTYNFSEYDGSSPYTAITSAGNVVDQTVGFADKATTLEFLNKNGLAE